MLWQVRRQSTTPAGGDEAEKGIPQRRGNQKQVNAQPVPFFPLLLRIIRGSLRSLVLPFRGQTMRNLYKTNPEELILALAVYVQTAMTQNSTFIEVAN